MSDELNTFPRAHRSTGFGRRGAIALCAVTTLLAALPARTGRTAVLASSDDLGEWQQFKRRFVHADGRVVDNGNGGISHTEGQGLGLLFAVTFGDEDTFERISGWTSANLQHDRDALHAWRFEPSAREPVADWNNATDGDIFIASALWQGAQAWGRSDHALAATAIATDILGLLVREVHGRKVLLPGMRGFEKPDSVLLNPSYYVFPMLPRLAEATPSPLWAELRQGGLALLGQGRFGRWSLPTDWVRMSRVDGALSPAPGKPERFSYDAIRVPLYLAWARLSVPELTGSLRAFWSAATPAPAWTNVTTNALAPYPAPSGFIAVADASFLPQEVEFPADFPQVATAKDYYSAALTLLARVAWRQVRSA